MNKRIIFLLSLIIVLVALVFLAVKGYDILSSEYSTEEAFTNGTTAQVEPFQSTKAESTEQTSPQTFENATASFTVYDKNGNAVHLSDFFGKPIVVNFWASWCSPCTSEMPYFEELFQKYGDDIHFLMINVGDKYKEAFKFIDDKGYSFPVYHDSQYDASYTYGVSSIPMTLFINKHGELATYKIGTMNKSTIEKGIALIN